MNTVNLIIAPGDSLFYPVGNNVIKYVVKYITIFNKELHYLIYLEAQNYWGAKLSSEYPAEFTIIPEAIGKMVYYTPEEAAKYIYRKE